MDETPGVKDAENNEEKTLVWSREEVLYYFLVWSTEKRIRRFDRRTREELMADLSSVPLGSEQRRVLTLGLGNHPCSMGKGVFTGELIRIRRFSTLDHHYEAAAERPKQAFRARVYKRSIFQTRTLGMDAQGRVLASVAASGGATFPISVD
ncbi:uncharacterized protein LOC135806920 isoform X1 [Sycon ciliatum]|uniref:uncharacterized protein LOC135806920 isoform X1 n=1 Tax=Sycon ciliatum TaxID=27933 RepID=UPI0031F71119